MPAGQREQLLFIHTINERFGTDFTEADQLFFDQIVEAASENESITRAADANPLEKFALLFHGYVENLMAERMEQNEEIFARYLSDPKFQETVNEWMAREVYLQARHVRPEDSPSDFNYG